MLHSPKASITQKPCYFWTNNGGVKQASRMEGEETAAVIESISRLSQFFLLVPWGEKWGGGEIDWLEKTKVNAEFDDRKRALPRDVEVVVEIVEVLWSVVDGVFEGEMSTPGLSMSR